MDNKFIDSLKYSLIDSKNNLVSLDFLPVFITNQNSTNNVLNNIRDEFNNCIEFYFSIAFITKEGLLCLKMKLDELKEKGIKGKIITADYLYFNNPEVFEDLLNIENVEVRICQLKNFHPKGYIFKQQNDLYSIMIGSANITNEALKGNVEWNLKFNSFKEGDLFKKIMDEFEYQWDNSIELTSEWIQEYRKIYENNQNQIIENVNKHEIRFTPNKMQQEAIDALSELRNNNKNKALIISATGTGKTYLAVFDVQQFNAKKVLFIAHRDTILKGAKESFSFIFNNTRTYGFINANNKDFDADFVFASNQTLTNDEYLNKFSKDHFDYIIIDEAHHSAANSIRKIIEYFEPKFLLGLTATPHRTDGQEIYSLFGNNIGYEINLRKALDSNLLCRFNYFGINDKYLTESRNPIDLCNDKRIDYIIEKAKYYGCYNNAVQGLVFVSCKKEAKILTDKFNERGIRTKYILAETKEHEKQKIINELQERKLDYIVSVDVLSEGVDMPFVNQIIMLRPTKSIIVFSQQLGRGLRKYSDNFSNKEYLVVLDFIGNYYHENFLIPLALSNSTKVTKDNIKKTLVDIKYDEFDCNIEFDRISQESIIKSIDNSNLVIRNNFIDNIAELKIKLNKIPNHMDILNSKTSSFYEVMDVFKGTKSKLNSYIEFLINQDYLDKEMFSKDELKYFEFLTREILSGKNIELINCVKYILENKIEKIYHDMFPILNTSFFYDNKSKQYISLFDGKFIDSYKNNLNFKEWIDDILLCSETIYNKKYKSNQLFKINEEYSRKDVCKLIKLANNQDNVINGYKIFEKENKFLIFVKYKKQDDIVQTQNYEDHFLNRKVFVWESRNYPYTENKELYKYEDFRKILDWSKQNKDVDLFIKKSDYDSKEFFYLGKTKIINDSIKEYVWFDQTSQKQMIKLTMKLELETEVDYKIYEYFND